MKKLILKLLENKNWKIEKMNFSNNYNKTLFILI